MKPTNKTRTIPEELTFEPLNKTNWDKLAGLFGDHGACGNCWCMYYRCKNQDFIKGKINDGNKNALRSLVDQNKPLGLIGLYGGRAVAWCAFSPREHLIRLENSRVHKRIDQEPVWSVPCFFIDKNFRGHGITAALLKAVIQYAKDQRVKIIEAYPTIPKQDKLPEAFAWVGLYKFFEKAGFVIVDTTSKRRPMVRYYINEE